MKRAFTWLASMSKTVFFGGLVVAAAFFVVAGRVPFIDKATQNVPNVSSLFGESAMIEKVAQVLAPTRPLLSARSEAKSLVHDGITGVGFYNSGGQFPTVVVRIRCGLYKGNESAWAAVLEHWCRHYCFKANIPSVEGRIVNCEDRAVVSQTYSFE